MSFLLQFVASLGEGPTDQQERTAYRDIKQVQHGSIPLPRRSLGDPRAAASVPTACRRLATSASAPQPPPASAAAVSRALYPDYRGTDTNARWSRSSSDRRSRETAAR